MPNPPTYPPDKPRAIAQQLFQCADDNWLQIMDPTRQFDYATMPTMWDVMAEADVDLETEAGQQDAFRRRPLEAWLADLRAADIAAEPAFPVGEVLRHADVVANRYFEIGIAHVRTPVTNAPLVCRLLLDNKKKTQK